ncbi:MULTISPECIES: hypothetical protein [unclassified Nocardiopsis]|uniref:hypothetical protein n=1 Tax=unclassified Nocardiopsis TaxID=2649073 RepID=UPI001356E1D9|nr:MULTISPECIES: hypothetical protein [unclassified Nocardiopsis]
MSALSSPARAVEEPQVTSTGYPAWDDFHGSPGRPGEFTFPSNGVEDVQSYFYALNDDPCVHHEITPEEPGEPVTATLAPCLTGPDGVYARTVDTSGNSSDCVLVRSFLIAPPGKPVVHLTFDEGQGSRAADTAEVGVWTHPPGTHDEQTGETALCAAGNRHPPGSVERPGTPRGRTRPGPGHE